MPENTKNSPCEIVALDIGGTHARFVLAHVTKEKVLEIGEPVTLKCAEYPSLAEAWKAFAHKIGRPLPRRAGIAIACPLIGESLKMTNNPWVLRQSQIAETLGLDDYVLVNDFAAVAHAVAHLGSEHFRHLCGPEEELPQTGSISIVGPGTGLGVALLLRPEGAPYEVVETEAGHIAYAPQDELEDQILQITRDGLCRVSSERIVSGPGLSNIYKALGQIRNLETPSLKDNRMLWQNALEGKEELARQAFERFCLSLGSVCGDITLAHGAKGFVVAGGIGSRIANHLSETGFAERFQAKGRFQEMMSSIPVKIITYPEPGLFGAAAAYANKIA